MHKMMKAKLRTHRSLLKKTAELYFKSDKSVDKIDLEVNNFYLIDSRINYNFN